MNEPNPGISLQHLVFSQAMFTDELLHYPWDGDGIAKTPYMVEWINQDPQNLRQMPDRFKWSIKRPNQLFVAVLKSENKTHRLVNAELSDRLN
jgi:hypothetical protein